MAGFRELLAIDFDDNAVATFALNFPEIPVWQRDITKVTADEILSFCKIEKGDLDVFDGSPPCQGFSTAGSRKVDDPRNSLFMEFVRLIEGLRPKVFLMENVSGQVKGKMKGAFIEILRCLRGTGYVVRSALLSAMWYGVPQNRERMIYIGVRPDVGAEPSFPRPSARKISVFEAIGDLEDFDDGVLLPKFGSSERASKVFSQIREGQTGADVDKKGGFFNLAMLDRLKPAPTIMKSHFSSSGMLHYDGKRWLTIAEAKRLASFPDNFEFIGKYEQQWARIGNAVMPLFMRALATHIRREILRK
jgi:DNA (cytosine-5)-methyltransferase 1